MRQSVASYYVTLWMRTAALLALYASVVALFVLSSSVLDSLGYHYDVEGGTFLEKVHPATLLVALCLGLRIASDEDPVEAIKRIFLADHTLLVAFASFAVLEFYVVAALHVPATPPFDTYLLPILYCFALRGLNARCARTLAIVIIAIFAANAVFALYERATGTRLFFVIPTDITGHPEDPNSTFDWKGHLAWDWRSSALFGHPLENAMLTGCFILVLQSRACRWIPVWLRGTVLALQLAAMLTFGGRVALVLVAAVSAAWGLVRARLALRRGRRLTWRQQATALLVILVVVAGLTAIYQAGLLDKIIERFADDEGSAQTRLTMWRLFDPLSWSGAMLGPDPDVVATYQRLQGLELGIESFWAGLPLTYGIVMMLVVLTGWVALSLYLVRMTRRASFFVIVFYFGVGSASAGLASKTTSVGILAVLVLVLMRRPAKAPLRAPARVARGSARSTDWRAAPRPI